jgi:hypothetical protein
LIYPHDWKPGVNYYTVNALCKGGNALKAKDYLRNSPYKNRFAEGDVLVAMAWVHAYQTTEPLPHEVTDAA